MNIKRVGLLLATSTAVLIFIAACKTPCEPGTACDRTDAPLEETVQSNGPDEQLVIVSIGDSFVSGEGNPDQPSGTSPIWTAGLQDPIEIGEATICHRSSNNSHLYAANEVASLWRVEHPNMIFSDPLVEIKSFACSGATITKGLLAPQYSLGEDVWDDGALCTAGMAPCEKSQLDQVREWLQANDLKLDVLLVSIGGNDIGFGSLISTCAQPFPIKAELCQQEAELVDMVFQGCSGSTSELCQNTGNDPDNPHVVGLDNLGGALEALGEAVDQLREDHQPQDPFQIILTGYPSVMRDYYGEPCNHWDDNFEVRPSVVISPVGAIIPAWMIGAETEEISQEEVVWGETQIAMPLNDMLKEFAQDRGWVYVDDALFSESKQHGFCSVNRWVHTFRDAFKTQGSVWGAAHPNIEGHTATSELIVPALVEALELEQNWAPNKITVSGSVYIVDDDLIDVKETYELHDEFFLSPPVFVPETHHQVNYEFCVGGEVKVDLQITVSLDESLDADTLVETRFFESTVCYKSFEFLADIESTDEMTKGLDIAANSEEKVILVLQNDEPGSTDSAKIDLTIANMTAP
jgi:hypothetical protein